MATTLIPIDTRIGTGGEDLISGTSYGISAEVRRRVRLATRLNCSDVAAICQEASFLGR